MSKRPLIENESSLVEKISENMTESVTGKTIFGESIEQDGTTIIPVSRIRYGFGAGYGHSEFAAVSKGGGGGLMAEPVGYIELKEGQSRFKPIHSSFSLATVILASGIAGLLLLKGIGSLVQKIQSD